MEHLKKDYKNPSYVASAVIGKERYDFIKVNNLSVSKILRDAIDRLMCQENEAERVEIKVIIDPVEAKKQLLVIDINADDRN